MIVVKLIGGLGNQMFQYAAGRALALARNTELKLDTASLLKNAGDAYTQRHYELDVFQIQADFATSAETDVFSAANTAPARWLQRKLPALFRRAYAAEQGQVYFDGFFKLPELSYLEGFWQNERYFKHIRDILLQEFALKSATPDTVSAYLEKIQNSNSVSLHVRRGDYVNNASAAAFHGGCSQAYYTNALEKIKTQVGNVEVFVFSDDLTWCKTNLALNVPLHFVNHNAHPCWDLFLMSRCRHNIIANSSFSWWGAWLNAHREKMVIAPQFWFNGVESKKTGILAQGWQTENNV